MHGRTFKESISHPLRTFKELLLPKNRRTLLTSIFFTGLLAGSVQMMFAPGRQESPLLPKVSFYDASNAYRSLHVQIDSLMSATSRQQALELHQSIKKNAQIAAEGFRSVARGEQDGITAPTALTSIVMIEFIAAQADSHAAKFGIETPLQK